MSSSLSAPTEPQNKRATASGVAQNKPVAAVIPLVPAWRVDHTFDYAVPAELIDALEPGSLVRVPFGGRRVRAVVTTIEERTPDRALETIAGVVTAAPVAPPPMVDVFDWIARRYVTPRGKAFARAVPSRVRVRVDALPPLPQDPSPDLVGSYAGGTEMIAAIEKRDPDIWCFECLPTHDRSRLIAELVAAAGRGGDGTALVCVPEVRYGSLVLDGLDKWMTAPARVDSAQSEADRSRSLLALAAGRGVGAGGRAALLAPARGLRLIVVDEEPHRSYKEDRSPRYDARRLAIHRARLSGAVCVLMGTTLSVESGAAARTGEFGWVTPGRRERRDARPVVEFAERDEGSSLSRLLHGRIKDVLASGGRTALLAPAAGYSRAVWCVQCRRSLRCDVCEAGMFFDRATGRRLSRLRCPRCSNTESPPEACPNCGGTDFRWLGAGSERLAEQLQKAFPRALVVRADPDDLEASTERALQADIYVTTWIGTKASLRPEVSLVGVI
ncbi:MAG TPA: hypothetical protein VNP73_10820, partial [Actinomycetota bacterium]|nr:hypothetical protein [Actinomycetota bacterium]